MKDTAKKGSHAVLRRVGLVQKTGLNSYSVSVQVYKRGIKYQKETVNTRLTKMENPKDAEKDRQRAEVFDALGHPTRIILLKVLSEGALGFADLKKKTALESSGHLQHHLTKLNGLIKTDEYGKYCLSEQGKDALLTVQTVENVSLSRETKGSEKPHLRFSNMKVGSKSWALLLSALLIVSSAVALYEYTQAVALQREIERFREIDVEAMAYYNEFGVIPDVNVNSSFSPPVSVYRALQLGLQAGGWNKTSLYGMGVGAYLRTWKQITDPDVYNFTVPIEIDISQITVPRSDYSPVYGEGVVYRYVWNIVVSNSTVFGHPPPGFALIDAATGQILPNPPLY